MAKQVLVENLFWIILFIYFLPTVEFIYIFTSTSEKKITMEYCPIHPKEKKIWGCPRDVIVKTMDCRIVVSEFVFQSRYYVHFQTNTLENGMNPLSSQIWVK